MIGGLTGQSKLVRRTVAAVLALGVCLSLPACSSSDSPNVSSTAPLSITVSPSVITPTTGLLPSSSASSPGSPSPSSDVPPQSSNSQPSESSSTQDPSAELTTHIETNAAAPSTFSLAIPEDGLPPAEADDRRAIESQWLKFWDTNLRITDVPPDELEEVVAAVAVYPVKTGLVEAARKARLAGQLNYGDISHRIFWNVPIGTSGEAVIGDCQDQSRAGSVDSVTGEKSKPGGSQLNYRGFFRKGADGIWRVSRVEEQVGVGCPPS